MMNNNKGPIRVLLVDDSPTICGLLKACLKPDPEIEIVAVAHNAIEARDAVRQFQPDVITLDIEMPGMDGLEFLERLMKRRPTPVVMISSLTERSARASIRAMSLGAVDCIPKPANGTMEALKNLPSVLKSAAQARVGMRAAKAPSPSASPIEFSCNNRNIVAIGSSTGGVEALIRVIGAFPENCPPTVITQHMPSGFTGSLAARLDKNSAATVSQARDGDVLEAGRVYLAPGGTEHMEVVNSVKPVCRIVSGDPVNGHRPSVDVLFSSIAQYIGDRAVGVLLTGMGCDGAKGLLEIKNRGGYTIGQDEASSVVYGMPRVAAELNAVTRQLPLDKIARDILQRCSRPAEKARSYG